MSTGNPTESVSITGQDFDNLSERAQAFIVRHGVAVVSERTGLSRAQLRRIQKNGMTGKTRGLTAIRLIAALKGYRLCGPIAVVQGRKGNRGRNRRVASPAGSRPKKRDSR